MPEPMSDERLAEIRERAESVKTWTAVWGPPIPQLCDADIPDLLAEVEWRKRGGKELGKVVVRLAELIKAAFVKGETDPAGALLMLGDHLAELFEDEGGLPADDHNRIYRALETRREDPR